MPSKTDIAWLSGLLEGEGCFRLQRPKNSNGRPTLVVKLQMTDLDVVERAASMFPTSTKIYRQRGRRGQTGVQWSDSYSKQWSGVDAEKIMCVVLPYMGERRGAKIRQCLATSLSHHPRPELKAAA